MHQPKNLAIYDKACHFNYNENDSHVNATASQLHLRSDNIVKTL
jgi:hypothetical protein